ncbi:hypothetical protein [uncultured Cyclobacterium sp.]|uniref:hypothetical protein n=1 Tax=uncultured Cyclobacterium sp. TaxID=453820 RepID=UPI0030EF6501|tara:strand:- start:41915 stop:42580 length:666 start_codon:yes stop_codon:yes gene_type:complete
MESYFSRKFKEKSIHELELIVANKDDYQADAVCAAEQLLKAHCDIKNKPNFSELEQIHNKKIPSNSSGISQSLDPKPFLKTFSYREIITIIALSLLFHSLLEVIGIYSNDPLFIFKNTLNTWKIVLLLSIFLLNHIVYRLEHNRSNNFIGRLIIDLIFLFFLIIIKIGFTFLIDSSYRISIKGNGLMFFIIIFGLVFLFTALELIVAFLKFSLKKIRCQIF